MSTTPSGNTQAKFYDLIWPHAAAVLRTAQFLTHSATEADDLAQETMLKAFRSIEALDDPQRVRPWLMTILRRARVDAHRQGRSRDRDVSLDHLALDPADAEHVQTADVRDLEHDPDCALDEFCDQDVICALKELPKDIRWTLLLVDVEGFDMNEAAGVLEVPVGTVKSRLHRGRSMLKVWLMERTTVMAAKAWTAKTTSPPLGLSVPNVTLTPATCARA